MKAKPLLIHTYNAQRAMIISLIGGILLTGLSTLAHVNRGWVLDEDFHIVYSFISNTLIFFLILFYNFTVIKSRLSMVGKYSICIAGSLLIAAGLSVLSNAVRKMLYDDLSLLDASRINLLRDLVLALVAMLVALLIYNLTRRLQMRLEKEQLQTENLMVRYEALESQINPHFLFNSLNTLGGLIGNDDERAQRYLQQFSATYRYIMQGKRLVTLEEELGFVENYGQMMEIRYGKNLHIEQHVDAALLHCYVVPISIQLLLENAIKHNVVSDRYPLRIEVATTDKGTIRVSNAMRLKQGESDSSGMGLANLGKRYQLLGQRDISITSINNVFTVEVPLIEPQAASKMLEQLNNKKS